MSDKERRETVYTYGEDDLAADRLALLAELSERASRSFLSEAVGFRPHLALDLGSGLGHSTHLIAEVLEPDQVVGVERSASFLSKAQAGAREGISFVEPDVTRMPLPYSGEADLIYARMLLSHLTNPEGVVIDWLAQLAPGGLLLLDEVEQIETEHPVFRAYLEILTEMMTHHGQELYVGPRLDAASERLKRRMSRLASAAPTTAHAAKMFSMNLANWRENEFVRANYSEEEIDRLEADLSALTASRERGEICWGLRQIAIERTPPT